MQDSQPDISELSFGEGYAVLDTEAFLANPDAIILDIRSEGEYAAGHIPGAHSFPLFSNQERAEIGTLYKQRGKSPAIERGLELVGKRLHLYVKEAKQFGCDKAFYLYCWRGGMRSNSMAWLLSTAGLRVWVLAGGYKAYRQSFLEVIARPWQFITLYGYTGAGKTELLNQLSKQGAQVLDLEGLAHHKGSAFGSFGEQAQPNNETFFNAIHHVLRSFDPRLPVWVEGESITIGSCFIPNPLFEKLSNSPYFEVTMSRQERIERLMAQYGSFEPEMVVAAFQKIAKRMGLKNAQEAAEAFVQGDIRRSVELALNYYDKGYAQSIQKRGGCSLGVLTLENHNHALVAESLSSLNLTNLYTV